MMQARGDEKEENRMPDEGIETTGILALNGLTYKLPPDLSVAIQRNNQSMYFQSQSYGAGATCVCVLNTGSSFVDFRRSFLVMTVRNESTPSGRSSYFGPNGSACNLINRIMIQTRSGAQIERVDNNNQLCSARLYMEHANSWTGRQYTDYKTSPPTDNEIESGLGPASIYGCQGCGFAQGASPAADDSWISGGIGGGQSIRFCIPLGELSTVWKHSQSLWPAALCSGLRLELLLEQPNQCMVSCQQDASTTSLGYSVQEIYLQLECYQLSDLVLRELNTMASTSSLEVVSVTAHDTQGTRSSSQNSMSLDCGRAASRALCALYRERPAIATVYTAAYDPMATLACTSSTYISNMQFRVGNLYFPQQGVKAFGTDWRTAANELYANSLQALGRFGIDESNCATSVFKFRRERLNIYQTLERSNVIDQSGIPLSNSRLLNVQQTWVGTPGASTLIDLFLFYSVLIKVYLNGASIEV
jgi:hypothetical protein